MDYEQILVDRRDDVLILTLNRPEKLNAWTPKMSAELSAAIIDANTDDDIGAMVITGAGRGFCAGADISGQFAANLDARQEDRGQTAERESASTRGEARGPDWITLCRQSKPLVAAINGPCIGVGLTMVLPFDQLLAAEGARLSLRFVKMGLVPELASSHFLVTRCGWGAASWLALSGTTVFADEALRLRLVDRVVPPDTLLDEAVAVAAELGSNPGPQVRMIKELLTVNATEGDLARVQQREIDAIQLAYRSPEHREAVTAFMEKREPNFRRAASGS
jgi:2-(1,2-epoxy-1,2-dihydrophenyl)acetyl-CoA isomerase